jgi:AAA family ATP:ADP antiporter
MGQKRVYWCCGLAFVSLLSYGLVRSPVDSLLLDALGPGIMPYAYTSVAVAVLIVVTLYSRLAVRHPLGVVQAVVAGVSAAILIALMQAQAAGVPKAALLLYVWKEIYIVLLVELIWSLANAAIDESAARWSYGLFCAAGSVGDMTGSFLSSNLAPVIGSENIPWLVVPNLALVAIVGWYAARAGGWPRPTGRERTGFGEIFRVLRKVSYVRYLVALIVVIQVATTLIDNEYKTLGASTYPDMDARTVLFARVDIIISAASLVLQLGSGIVLALLGLRLLTLLLPAIVGSAALAYAIHPSFLSVAILRIANKTIDYSLFRTSKELFYRPLSYKLKMQGKAAADILGYRTAKGGAGVLLQTTAIAGFAAMASVIGMALWCILALRLLALREAPNQTAESDASGGGHAGEDL